MLKAGVVVAAPIGLIAENPLIPKLPVAKVLALRVGVPNDIEEGPLPNENPVEPPPNPPVVAAAIFLPQHCALKEN